MIYIYAVGKSAPNMFVSQGYTEVRGGMMFYHKSHTFFTPIEAGSSHVQNNIYMQFLAC